MARLTVKPAPVEITLEPTMPNHILIEGDFVDLLDMVSALNDPNRTCKITEIMDGMVNGADRTEDNPDDEFYGSSVESRQ